MVSPNVFHIDCECLKFTRAPSLYGQRFNNRPITTNRVKKKCITCLSSSCWASSLDCLITSRLCRRCLEKGRLLEGQSIFIRAFEKQNTSQINSSSLKTLRELGARLGMYEKRHENALQNLSATVDKTRQRTVRLFFVFPTVRNVITQVRSSVTASDGVWFAVSRYYARTTRLRLFSPFF